MLKKKKKKVWKTIAENFHEEKFKVWKFKKEKLKKFSAKVDKTQTTEIFFHKNSFLFVLTIFSLPSS